MQQLRSHHTASQIAIDVDVLWIHHIFHPHHARIGLTFINIEQGNVGMLVNDTGGQVFVGSIYYSHAIGRKILSDFRNLAIAH